jgi:hypothetical protein
VLAHKIREAMASEMRGVNVGGEGRKAEIDGGYFGGYVKPANLRENRRDRRLRQNQSIALCAGDAEQTERRFLRILAKIPNLVAFHAHTHKTLWQLTCQAVSAPITEIFWQTVIAMSQNERTQEVERNFVVFQQKLPELMKSHPGKFALLHSGEIVEFCDTVGDTVRLAKVRFPAGDFSIRQSIG